MPSKVTAPRALSLHLGLNTVSQTHYGGWDGELAACEFDALDMADIARGQGMVPTVLLSKKATRAATLAALRKGAKALKPGDFFFLSFSGHGGQVPDRNGDEADRQDETWCLYDGQLIDDELYLELSKFAAGVRVLVLSDSCHSGTVTRAARPPVVAATAGPRPRLMPGAIARRVYAAHSAFYDDLQTAVLRAAESAQPAKPAAADPDAALAQLSAPVGAAAQAMALVGSFKPAVVLISGCQDNQTSLDGEHNGAFTEAVLKVWNGGRYAGSLSRFHALVRAALPPTQSPNLFALGPAAALLKAQPFKV